MAIWSLAQLQETLYISPWVGSSASSHFYCNLFCHEHGCSTNNSTTFFLNNFCQEQHFGKPFQGCKLQIIKAIFWYMSHRHWMSLSIEFMLLHYLCLNGWCQHSFPISICFLYNNCLFDFDVLWIKWKIMSGSLLFSNARHIAFKLGKWREFKPSICCYAVQWSKIKIYAKIIKPAH